LKNILLSLICLAALAANAQVTDTVKKPPVDSIKKDITSVPDTVKQLHSKGWTYIPPVAMVTYGILSLAVPPIRHIDFYLARRIKTSDPTFHSKVEDFLQAGPVVLVYGLNLVGDHGKNRFVDRTALLALSGGILTIVDGLKFVTHRARPYSTDKLSFPSGHTGAAFLAAEFLAQEYSDKSPVYSVIGYTMAATTGVLRLYDREHWFSDIVAGAGFGMLSVKAAYLIYPSIRKIFTHKDKQGRSTMIMPSYQYGAPGLAFAMTL
jgi:membrane-associated phospholipid phosphatase